MGMKERSAGAVDRGSQSRVGGVRLHDALRVVAVIGVVAVESFGVAQQRPAAPSDVPNERGAGQATRSENGSGRAMRPESGFSGVTPPEDPSSDATSSGAGARRPDSHEAMPREVGPSSPTGEQSPSATDGRDEVEAMLNRPFRSLLRWLRGGADLPMRLGVDDLQPPTTRPTEREIDACYRDVAAGLRSTARPEIRRRIRERVLFGVIRRARCPGWDAELRRQAALAQRNPDDSNRALEAFFSPEWFGAPGESGFPQAADNAFPRHVLVRGVDATQGGTRMLGARRLLVIRAVDRLSLYEELVPVAQVLWGMAVYNGGCVTWDLAAIHADLREGRIPREPYRPEPGETRESMFEDLVQRGIGFR